MLITGDAHVEVMDSAGQFEFGRGGGAMNESYRDHWQTRRLGRRPLFAAGLAGSATAFAVACGRDNNTATGPGAAERAGTAASSAAREPKRGGVFRYVNTTVDALDPATAYPTPLLNDVYEPFAFWNRTEQKAIPHLARAWEQPDASTVIFHMEP